MLPGGPVAYITEPEEGPFEHTLVALHGLPGSSRDFRWLGPALPKGMRLIRIDQPGFGGTPLATMADPAFTARARWVMEVLDALEVDPAILLGHSVGGFLAMETTRLFPDRVSHLALVASVGLRPHLGWKRFGPVGKLSWLFRTPGPRGILIPLLRKAFEAWGFPKGLSNQAIQQTVHIMRHVNFAHTKATVKTLALPTLLAWADDDALIEADIADELQRACPSGPRLHTQTGGHNLQKTQAIEIAQALGKWLNP